MMNNMLPVLVPVLLLAIVSAQITPQSHIRFQDNAYSGLTVSFSPDIPFHQRDTLITHSQRLFQKTSDLLYEASQHKAFFKEVNFIIPKSWPTNTMSITKTLGLKKTRTQTIGNADFIVKHSALFDNPLTVQFAGCGKPGLQIQLSSKFISKPPVSEEVNSKILLSNWAKFRYGVFDEHGFLNDKLYPLFWNTPGADASQEKVTSCAATASGHVLETIHTKNKTSTGAQICSLRLNPENGQPVANADCIPFADEDRNDNVVSSLLSHPVLRNSTFFCDKNSHNVRAPNKQNNLCEGSSVAEVISRHPDFTSSRPADFPNGQPQIVFRLFQEEDPRLTFIVDIHSDKIEEKTALTNAFRRLKSTVNDMSEFLILNMKNSHEIHWDMNQDIHWKNRKDVKVTTWGRDDSPSDGICLKCALDYFLKGQQSLKTPGDISSELVIITEGKMNDKESDMDAIADKLLRKEVPLRVVVFPYIRGSDIEPIQKLVSKVKGSIHLIPRDSRPQEQLVVSELRLFSAFDSFLTMNQNILIARQSLDPVSDVAQFNFHLDDSLFRSNVELITKFYDRSGTHLNSRSMVLSGEGKRLSAMFSSEFDEVEKQFVVPLNNALPGSWKLEMNSSRPVVGVAYARVSGRPIPISGKCIISQMSLTGGRFQPPTLFVSLTQDETALVQKAQVKAVISDDAGNPLPGTDNLTLFDDGLASPDITEGDGIYSRYLTEVNQPGFYSIQVLVRSQDSSLYSGSHDGDGIECCGSSMPKPYDKTAVTNLERVIDCGSLFVDMPFNPEQFTERISDLKVHNVDAISRKVVIEFSEPIGADIRYQIKMFPESAYSLIRTAFDDYGEPVGGRNVGPFVDHEHRTHPINLSSADSGVFHVAIRVSNQHGAQHTISNIVTFFMAPDPATMTTEADDPLHVYTSRNPTAGGLRGFEVWQVVAVAAIAVIFIAILIACCICLCLKRKRRSSKADSEPQKNSFPAAANALHSNLTIQTTMGSTMGSADNMSDKIAPGVNNGMHGMKLSAASSDRNLSHFAHAEHMTVDVNNTISPVQSWPAELLLGHYGKVQQARERKESPPVVKIEDVLPDGSYSTGSDNPSHASSQYDEQNLDHGYPVTMTSGPDWRYENVSFSHAQPAYVSPYGGIPHQFYGEPVHAYDPTQMAMWQERPFVPQRPQTPSDASYPPDGRYQPQQRRSNTVSQV